MSTGLVHLPDDFRQRCANYYAQLKVAFQSTPPSTNLLRLFRAKHHDRIGLEDADAEQIEAVFLHEQADRMRQLRRECYKKILAVAYQSGSRDQRLLDDLTAQMSAHMSFDTGERETLEEEFRRDLEKYLASAKSSTIAQRAIDGLSLGKASSLLFLEAQLDGLHIVTVQAQPNGEPLIINERSIAIAWQKLLPHMPSEPTARMLMLAGGIALTPKLQLDLQKGLAEALHARLPAYLARNDCILVQHTYGWQIHDLLVDALQQTYDPRHLCAPQNSHKLHEVVDELLANAALRHTCSLLVASINATSKKVQVVSLPLFKRGHSRTKGAKVQVEVVAADYTHQPLQIAVVTNDDKGQEHLLAGWSLDLPPYEHCTLTFELVRPSQVELSSPVSIQPSTEKLSDIRSNVPQRMDRPINRFVDLVVILDTIGIDSILAERCAYVREFVAKLKSHMGSYATLRMGLLAYADHNHIESQHYNKHPLALHSYDLADPESTCRELDGLTSTQGQDFEAALEDALAELSTMKWHPQARRVVVTIGSRPPHPLKPTPGWRQVGSPRKIDWRAALAKERSNAMPTALAKERSNSMLSIALVCPIVWPITDPTTKALRLPSEPRLPAHAIDYAIACWREIGYTALLPFSETSPASAAEIVGTAIAEGTAQLRLPILTRV